MDTTVAIGVISAGSALMGAAIPILGAKITSARNRREDRADLRRSKFESLLEHFDMSEQWVAKIGLESIPAKSAKDLAVFALEPSLVFPEHARKVRSLALAYFPELVKPAERYFVDCYLTGQYFAQCWDPTFDDGSARIARANLGMANSQRNEAARTLEEATKTHAPAYVPR